VFVAAVYCKELALVNGTLACSAVLGYLNSPKILNRLMGNVKIKFEKLHNRQHLLQSVTVIYQFIHRGDAAAVKRKVLLYRNMGGAMRTNEESEMAYRIVELLVCVAKGREPNDENTRGFFPYGKPASCSTMAFKSCPGPWFANALTFLYPYLVKPKGQWDSLKAKYTHPMNATGLWPQNILKRYMSFFALFRASRSKLFASYESQNGIYHGRDTAIPRTVTTGVSSSPKLTQKDIEDMSDESDDSVDGVF